MQGHCAFRSSLTASVATLLAAGTFAAACSGTSEPTDNDNPHVNYVDTVAINHSFVVDYSDPTVTWTCTHSMRLTVIALLSADLPQSTTPTIADLKLVLDDVALGPPVLFVQPFSPRGCSDGAYVNRNWSLRVPVHQVHPIAEDPYWTFASSESSTSSTGSNTVSFTGKGSPTLVAGTLTVVVSRPGSGLLGGTGTITVPLMLRK